jgi:uncharacterized protein YcbX
MLGEQLDEVDVEQGGIVGDRAFALVDVGTGKVASAKHPKVWPDLLRCKSDHMLRRRARGSSCRRCGLNSLTVPRLLSDEPEVDAVLSGFFRRDVRLARAAPEDFTIDQYHPDQSTSIRRGIATR